jgi:hypothetical protein
MNRLHTLPWTVVCGLVFSPAAPAQLTTIGPETPGVSESVLTLVPVSPQTSPPSFMLMQMALPPGEFGGGYMIGPDVGFTFGPGSSGCFSGCTGNALTPKTFRMLDISFLVPVSVVSVLQTAVPFRNALIIAYNSSFQEVGMCEGTAGPLAPPGACFTVISRNDDSSALLRYTISSATADITTLLVGGDIFDPVNEVQSVRFSVKGVAEPGTLPLFTLALTAMSLAARRKSARAGPRTAN